MRVNGRDYRSVWWSEGEVCLIDQNLLPFEFVIRRCASAAETAAAIADMSVRGAGAIGAAAGFALAQAFLTAPDEALWPTVEAARELIESQRPTARSLFWSTAQVMENARKASDPRAAALETAQRLAEADVSACRRLGQHGAQLIGRGTRLATHCNAGWLACVDHGTALAPVYEAQRAGKQPFVYVDETRPRGQGARLTAWELGQAGVQYAVIADNALAALMSQGEIDLVIVGADRIAANGDTVNKIGTLEKALAARAFGVPFYVAAPLTTFDPQAASGQQVIIEERDPAEVLYVSGLAADGQLVTVRVAAPGATARNPAFDVTPVRWIDGFITEVGILPPSAEAIASALATLPDRTDAL